jgi:hypothetical protein
LKSPASTVWTVRYAIMRGGHKAMVADILRTIKVKVASIGTILIIKKLQCKDSECRSCLMITWATEWTVNIIFVITDNYGIPNRSQR